MEKIYLDRSLVYNMGWPVLYALKAKYTVYT